MEALLFFLLVQLIYTSYSIQLDIHLPLVSNTSSCIYQLAEEANEDLNLWSLAEFTNEQIQFPKSDQNHTLTNTTQIPHMTLFLTDFSIEDEGGADNINMTILKELISTTRDAICHSLEEFPLDVESFYNVVIQQPIISAPYAMYRIMIDDQIQMLSDKIVQYTQPFVTSNQSIPAWVNNIVDEKVKLKKIEYVKKYGSPNVYDQFDPHVTVGYDDYNGRNSNEKDVERFQILDNLIWEQCSGWMTEVRIGFVGKYGTVIGAPLVAIDLDKCGKVRLFTPQISSLI